VEYDLVPGLPGNNPLGYQVWAILFTVRRCVFELDRPEVTVADEMGLGKIYISVAAAVTGK